jgi:phage repressor protein C with HTH and peptisase S24 domain
MDWGRIIDIAERIIAKEGRNKSDLPKILGVRPQYLSDLKSGKSKNPGSDFTLALINKLDINPKWIETGEGDVYIPTASVRKIGRGAGLSPGNTDDALIRNAKSLENHKSLPIYSVSDLPEGAFVIPLMDQQLSAGPGAALPEGDEVKALIRVPAYLSQYGENVAALTVEGDSMYPTLSRGDMVVCDSCGWSGEGIYAVRMGGSGFVKRLSKAPGKVVIISDNPKYPPREEPEGSEDFEIIGRVHCAITKVE